MTNIIKRQYSIMRNGVRYKVELTLDVDAIAHEMVNNAARNASGKASLMHGAIKAKVIEKI